MWKNLIEFLKSNYQSIPVVKVVVNKLKSQLFFGNIDIYLIKMSGTIMRSILQV